MFALGCWNVVERSLGQALGRNLSSNALIEGQWYLFDLAFLLGLGYTLQVDGDVRIDVVQVRRGSRRRAQVELAGTLLWLGVMVGANLQTSFLPLPFGFALLYLRCVAPPELSTGAIYRGVVPSIGLQLAAVLLVVVLFPPLVTAIPSMAAAAGR